MIAAIADFLGSHFIKMLIHKIITQKNLKDDPKQVICEFDVMYNIPEILFYKFIVNF